MGKNTERVAVVLDEPNRIQCIRPMTNAELAANPLPEHSDLPDPANAEPTPAQLEFAARITEYVERMSRAWMPDFEQLQIAAEKVLTSRARPAILHSAANEGSPDVERGRSMADVEPHEVVRAKIESDAAFENWQAAIVSGGDTEAAFAAWREATAKYVELMLANTAEGDEMYRLLTQDWADQRSRNRGE